ncbi:hypothetical protein KKC32_01095 [Patescibacteria group bacterium]|nr:hypothetical protein [Patescibacteria group bacterium]
MNFKKSKQNPKIFLLIAVIGFVLFSFFNFVHLIDKNNDYFAANIARANIENADAPKNPALIIDNGAVFTNSPEVSLMLSAENADQIMIANDSNFRDADWEKYETQKKWLLSPGAGGKIVYVKFKSSTGAESKIIFERIALVSPLITKDKADLNSDGTVDDHDLNILLDNWRAGMNRENNIQFDVCLFATEDVEQCVNSDYAVIDRINDNSYFILFDDKDRDRDFDDAGIKVIFTDDKKIEVRVETVNAQWIRKIRMKIFYKNKVFSETFTWQDSQKTSDRVYKLDLKKVLPPEEINRFVFPSLVNAAKKQPAETTSPLDNIRADINGDLLVDDYDLSILMHFWNGK